jgi:arylformamidase
VELFDISLPVHPAMLAWPTGRTVARQTIVNEGDVRSPRDSEWQLDSHAGTHIDAPLHIVPGADPADAVAIERCFGPCTVVGIERDGVIEPGDLPQDALQAGHRLLFRTPNSDRRLDSPDFDTEFASIGPEAAQRIADAGIALVGIDYLSVERPSGGGEVHRILLGAGIPLLEGLDLRGVEPGDYGLSALPVKWVGGEAAPVRAVLWR